VAFFLSAAKRTAVKRARVGCRVSRCGHRSFLLLFTLFTFSLFLTLSPTASVISHTEPDREC
jgi:hypothetical protein